MNEQFRRLLKRHEGVRSRPYMDTTGHVTIGVGRNLTDVGLRQDEIEYLLTNDIGQVYWDCEQSFSFFTSLDEVRQMVLMDMCFNLGIGGLMKFKNTLRAVEEGRYEDASVNMLRSKWATQVKGRAIELSEMMRTGIAPL
jgi:lysozyme